MSILLQADQAVRCAVELLACRRQLFESSLVFGSFVQTGGFCGVFIIRALPSNTLHWWLISNEYFTLVWLCLRMCR